MKVSESKITELSIYFVMCKGKCCNIFWAGDCVALFVFLGNREFERKPLKICETVRNEQPTVRP